MATPLAERIYNNNMNIVKLIDQHEVWKHDVLIDKPYTRTSPQIFKNLVFFLEDYKKEQKRCKRVCWADFITAYLFVEEKMPIATAKYIYNIYPNTDPKTNIMDPNKTPIFDLLPKGPVKKAVRGKEKEVQEKEVQKEGFNIRYDFRTKIVYSNFYNLLMLDYDIKDGLTREDAIEELYRIIEVGKRNYLKFSFAIMPTDRGLHAFLLSQYAYRNMIWVDFLRLACTDTYYAAFSYATGFGIRLSRKQDTPEDMVSWLSPVATADIEKGDVALSDIIDIGYPVINFKSQYLNKTLQFKVFGNALQIIGDTRAAKPDLIADLQLQYLFLQYFRSFTPLEIENIECEIYNAAIYPYTSRIKILQEDIYELIEINKEL